MFRTFLLLLMGLYTIAYIIIIAQFQFINNNSNNSYSNNPKYSIQGIRHREYCIEGVQFHPESVTSECGLELFRNFLQYRQGCWTEKITEKHIIQGYSR